MRNLGDLINRIKESLKDDVYIKETAAGIIQESTRATILPQSLSLKDGVLTISASALVKNEVFLKEEKIFQMFKEKNLPIRRIIYR